MAKEISIFIIILAVSMALFGAIGFFAIGQDGYAPGSFAEYATARLGVEGRSITVWIADTPEKQAKGLMGITHLDDGAGMLFVFADAVPQVFWNKDTLIDLDIIWISGARIVGISHLPKQRGEDTVHVASESVVDMVLEVPAGWAERNNVTVGSVVSMQ